MITELTQFIKDVPQSVKEKAIKPKVGLHIKMSFSNGQYKIAGRERYKGNKHGDISQFLNQCAFLQEHAWMIDTNKCFDLPAKGIHTASPYCVGFKLAMFKGDKNKSKELAKSPPSKEYKKKVATSIAGRLDSYFGKCSDPKFDLDEIEKQKAIQFKNHLKDQLISILEEADLGWDDYVITYNDVDIDKYKSFNAKYLAEGLFNTTEYNIEVNDEILGTSNFYNGFNSKKPFLIHQTASFDITGRISTMQAKELSEFSLLIGKKLFPNPLPVFIDDEELTNNAIEIVQREEGKRVTHRKIITELLKKKETLGNYYLLYFSDGAILDFDFVAKFEYYLNTDQSKWEIKNVTEITENKQLRSDILLSNVFDFESIVICELFNNTLVRIDQKKDEWSFRYFDKIDPKFYRPALYTLLLKYRKPIYDYIYKSMRSGIGANQFQDICMTIVIDDLKQNKVFSVKAKLNAYFSLYQYFDSKNQSIMPSKIEDHKKQLQEILDNEDVHFTSDDAYAFGAGQLIYYLLSQSESAERTHALLEPFLQKTNYAHFNEAIANIILRYKHAIGFNFARFNSLASEVLDYEAEKALQELRPILLAGYFCPNILYKSRKKHKNEKTI